MEVNKTGGLLYGSISEKYRSEVLPTGVESISYSFYYPDGKLDSGRMSIDFLFMHSSGVIIDIYYKYNHESDKLVQSLNIIDEKRLTDLNQIMEYVKEKKLIFHHTLLKVKNCYEIRLFQTGFPSILVNFQRIIGGM